jgi:RNA polymerase subunit RPABC4/transcription elongation factor Spt4
MPVKNESQTGLTAEIKIIPTWAWVVTGLVFVGAQLAFDILMGREHNAPPAWARPLLGLLIGVLAGGYLLLIGYINRDAKRRGMSPTLWTIVAIVIPNALGILLYFVLRHPLRSACPQCGYAVETAFSFCPRCSYKLSPTCSQCQRVVGVHDVFCPYCGNSLRNEAVPASGLPTKHPG